MMTVEPYNGFSLDTLKELIDEVQENVEDAEMEHNVGVEEDDQELVDFGNCDYLIDYFFKELEVGYNTCHEDKSGCKCNCAVDPILNAWNNCGAICCIREAAKGEKERYVGCATCEFPCQDIERLLAVRGVM